VLYLVGNCINLCHFGEGFLLVGALEKIHLKEVERKKKLDEKAKEKTEKEKGKKTNVQDEVLQPKPASDKGTKRDFSQLSVTKERLTLGPVKVDLDDDVDVLVDELIINSFLVLFIPEDGPKPQAFCDVVSFIEKVMHLEPLIAL
jgi:hypothetical protein